MVKAGTSPETQKTILRVIQEQMDQLTPYLLNRAKLECDLERRQLIDHKTGALNHQGIEERFRAEAIKLNTVSPEAGTEDPETRDERHMLLFEFDVDNFKTINDDPKRGHDVGDDILKDIVRNLREVLRPGDAIGRRGGDEFSVIVNDVNERDIETVKSKILTAIRIIDDRSGGRIAVTGAVRKIRHGEKTTYKKASEEADVAGAVAKVVFAFVSMFLYGTIKQVT